MFIEELAIIAVIVGGIFLYRNYKGQNVGKYVFEQVQTAYNKFAPYSFQVVREKTKALGQEYTPRQYAIQATVMGVFAGVVSYLYFYNLVISAIYVIAAISFIPFPYSLKLVLVIYGFLPL